jgi:Fibronectin type III domain
VPRSGSNGNLSDWERFRLAGNKTPTDLGVPAQMAAPAVALPPGDESGNKVLVTRAAAPSSPRPILQYNLRYSTNETTWTLVQDITPVQAVPGLLQSTIYYFQTQAVNENGEGPWSLSTSTSFGAPPFLETAATVEGRKVTVGVTVFGVPSYTFAMTANDVAVSPSYVDPGLYVYDVPSSAVPVDIEWTASATNATGTSTSSGIVTLSSDTVAPSLTNASAEVASRVLTVQVTRGGNPNPILTPSFTVDGGAQTLTEITTGVYTYTFADSAAAINYSGSITATNGVGSPAVYNFSGSVAANITVPSAFGAGDWSISEILDVPAAFAPGEWSLEDVPDEAPPPTEPEAFAADQWSVEFIEDGVPATEPEAFTAGQWSIENVTTDPEPPPPDGLTSPTNFTATVLSDRAARLEWGPPTSGSPTSYDAAYSLNGGLDWVTIPNVTSPYTINVLPWGDWNYSFRVQAKRGTEAINSPIRTGRTQFRPYGLDAEFNKTSAEIAARGMHPNETYIRDVLWLGNEGPGNGPQTGQGISWCNFFSRDYTYPVYRSRDATLLANVSAGDGNFRSGQIPWNPSWVIPAGTDGQIIVLDEDTGAEWNGFQCSYSSGSNTLSATRVNRITVNADGTGGIANYRAKSNGFRQSRGCGIQYLGMLITVEEIAQGKIYHALSMVMRRSGYRYYTVPATKGERYPGNEADYGIPQGTRFWLDISDAEIDARIATWPAAVPASTRRTMKIVFQAMRDYGWIATDQGGDNHIQFQHAASAAWEPYGIETDIVAGGKTYPRDAIDQLITDKTRIKIGRPADGVLHYYERGSDSPLRAPAHCNGTFVFRTPTGTETRQITDVGFPRIELSGSTTLVVTRQAQFWGQNPVTLNPGVWLRNGVQIATGGTSYNTLGTPGAYTYRITASNANGTSPAVTSNTITI